MALLSCGWPWFRGTGPSPGTGPTAVAPHSSAGHASCRHLCLLFSLLSFLPLLGQLRAWADLGGRSQAGPGRLGFGTQLDSRRSKMVKRAQREPGLASPPSEPVAGPESSTVPHPLGPPPDSKPCSSLREVTCSPVALGQSGVGLVRTQRPEGCSRPALGCVTDWVHVPGRGESS